MALFEKISDTIWDEILSGRIKIGEKLKDTEWAKKTGASRTPVREALRELVRDGVLVPRKLGGFILRQIRADEVIALYDYRAALEGAALKNAFVDLADISIDDINDSISLAHKALEQRDYEEVMVQNTKFHQLILKKCNNQFINDALNSANRMVLFARRSVLNQTSLARANEYESSLKADLGDHKRILGHLVDKRIEDAASMLEMHIRRTGDDMARMLTPN